MTEENISTWNNLTTLQKQGVVLLNRLSRPFGETILTHDFSKAFVELFNVSNRTISGLVSGLTTKGILIANPRQPYTPEGKSLRISKHGKDFIFNSRILIEDYQLKYCS
jgi:hypothetical protein